jgi:hypothetical protein
MGKVMLWVHIGSVKVYHFSIYFFGVVTDKSVLLVAFIKRHVLLE